MNRRHQRTIFIAAVAILVITILGSSLLRGEAAAPTELTARHTELHTSEEEAK